MWIYLISFLLAIYIFVAVSFFIFSTSNYGLILTTTPILVLAIKNFQKLISKFFFFFIFQKKKFLVYNFNKY